MFLISNEEKKITVLQIAGFFEIKIMTKKRLTKK